jgi:DNA-binding beta-propeller fold protein YncE
MDRSLNHRPMAQNPVSPRIAGRGSRNAAAVSLLLVASALAAPTAARANVFVELSKMSFLGRGGVIYEMPQSVTLNPRTGELAIANTGHGRVELLDPQARPYSFFVHRVTRPDGSVITGQPRGVCYDAEGNLFVTDNFNDQVDIVTLTGKVLGSFSLPGGRTAQGEAFDSTAGAMTLLKDGSLLVATRGNPARIHHFSADGRWLGAWGTPGEGPGRLSRIGAIAQAPSGEIVVACGGTELAIQRFDSASAYVAGFGRHEIGPGNFSYPSGIAITQDGRLWISDELRQSVQVFTADGQYLGTAGEGGADPGQFLYPTGVATDGKTVLAVIDRVGGRLQVFRIKDNAMLFRAPEGR